MKFRDGQHFFCSRGPAAFEADPFLAPPAWRNKLGGRKAATFPHIRRLTGGRAWPRE
jgi:hypothetical protein